VPSRAFITGVSRGLGAFLATRLRDDGWQVGGCGRTDPGDLDLTGIDYLRADLSDPADLHRLGAHLDPAPDLLVHNAISYPDPAGTGPGLDVLESVFSVNALSPYLLTRDLIAALPVDRPFHCVVINSESIYHADAQSAVYAASKAAMRVLTAGLADACRGRAAAVSTLLLGPLADTKKLAGIGRVAAAKGLTEEQTTRLFLRKSNPDLVIDSFIDYESCYRSLLYLAGLGPIGNGATCKLDGGSCGSLG
jgi:NAD(P)-dependent dehydrogenase (short-subunit alcohol dehydrogenase family)